MKKRELLYFLSGIFLTITVFLIVKYVPIKNDNNIISTSLDGKYLSIMLQKDENSDEYEKSQASSWPTEGYIFNPYLSNCENGSELSWKNNRVMVNTKTSDKCYVYFDKYSFAKQCEYENIDTGACDIARTYNTDETLLYHNGNITDDTGNVLDANDKSYRYSGASEIVNNYVCIDSKVEGACDNNDLYRVIGLFKDNKDEYEIKLIKSDYTTKEMLGADGAYKGNYSSDTSYYKNGKMDLKTIAGYYWTSSDNQSNLWKGSTLYETNLNQKFIAYLETKKTEITNQISEHEWITAGNIHGNLYSNKNVVDAYKSEIINYNIGSANSQATTLDEKTAAKIGLMYVSDYGYATIKTYWQTKLYDSNNNQDYRLDDVKNNNWMYMGLYEWTITRNAYNAATAFSIHSIGRVSDNYSNVSFNAVRPCFYLSSDTKFSSGNGTLSTPYRIEI